MWLNVKKFKQKSKLLSKRLAVFWWDGLANFVKMCVGYILNTPNFVSSIGAFKAALKLNPSTLLESTGSITPSSHILNGKVEAKSTKLSL